jgi:hypothetical protein
MPILDWEPGASPEAPGTLYFYEQGQDPATGFVVTSRGVIQAAVNAVWAAATAATVVASAIVNPGDTFDRWRLRADGRQDWGPGNATRDTNLYRAGTALLATDGSLSLAVAGGGIQVKEGTNATMGTATLVGGTATVSTSKVTANSRILLTAQTSGAAPGTPRVSARTAGTSFTITSTSGTDTSQVAWFLVEPSS